MSEDIGVRPPTDADVRPALPSSPASRGRRWVTLGLSALAVLGGLSVLPAADAYAVADLAETGPLLNEGYTVAASLLATGQATPVLPASAVLPAPVDPVSGSEVVDTAVTTALPDGRAATAIAAAMAQIGLPYVWGGDGPTAGDAGFDCSGLTTFAYGVAGIRLPRTAHTQYHAGPRVPAGASLQPGDLVFYGTVARVHHVGMYIGDGRMVNAPRRGQPVQTAYYRWTGDDYLGATRPAADGPLGSAPLPYVPPEPLPEAPVAPPEFVAPPAPLPPTLPAPTDPQPPEPETAARAVEESAPLVEDVPPFALTAAGDVPPTVVAPGAGTSDGAPTPPGTSGVTGPVTTPGSATSAVPPGSVPVGTTPPATTPPATTPPATTPPAAPTSTSATTAPVTSTATTLSPAPSAEPAPVRATEAVLPGGTVELRAVRLGADGLPARSGIWVGGGRSVVRLAGAAVAGGAGPGSAITVNYSDGTSRAHVVSTSAAATTAEAAATISAAPPGRLVVLVPAGEGSWTVVTASS